jgi:hypothetical protein
MFVPELTASVIEAVRSVVDPIQSSLIAAHVTLCRENELGDLGGIRARLYESDCAAITLRFGPPKVVMEHGILLECVHGLSQFRTLREQVLGSNSIKDQEAHITLAHPRNPKSHRNSLHATADLNAGLTVTFDQICLIEQQDAQPWCVVERYALVSESLCRRAGMSVRVQPS